MMTAARAPGFIDSLPKFRGRLQANAPLAPFTWFRAGGAGGVAGPPGGCGRSVRSCCGNLPLDVPVT